MNAHDWNFSWTDRVPARGKTFIRADLLWQGQPWVLHLDGLQGLDGRLDDEALDQLPDGLQQLLMQAAVAPLVEAAGRAVGVGLRLMHLHRCDPPPPNTRGLGFLIQRRGSPAPSLGQLLPADERDGDHLADALAWRGLPLPRALTELEGRWLLGPMDLEAHEFETLEVGDLIWLDGVNWCAQGLHLRWQGASAPRRSVGAWLRRSLLTRDSAVTADAEAETGVLLHSATLHLPRAWLLGPSLAPLRLPQPALALPWFATTPTGATLQGRLMVVGRRLGLRLTALRPAMPALEAA